MRMLQIPGNVKNYHASISLNIRNRKSKLLLKPTGTRKRKGSLLAQNRSFVLHKNIEK